MLRHCIPPLAWRRIEAWCRAIRALHFSGTDSLEQAITWIMEHEADPDLDEPLLVPEVSAQPATAEADLKLIPPFRPRPIASTTLHFCTL